MSKGTKALTQSEIEGVMFEAQKVLDMTRSEGWQILRRDILQGQRALNSLWMNYNKKSPTYDELRIKALAYQTMLDMVEHYEIGRKNAFELWQKLNLSDSQIAYDVDNESPLLEKEEV